VALALLAPWPSARLCIADAAYDSTGIRSVLLARGIVPVIPNNPHPQTAPSVRPKRLPQANPDRARLLPPQGFPTHRHTL